MATSITRATRPIRIVQRLGWKGLVLRSWRIWIRTVRPSAVTYSSGAHIGSFPGANPYVTDVFKLYPQGNSSSVGDGFNTVGYTFSAPAPDNLNMFVAKLDYNLTANGNERLFLRAVQDGDHNAAGPQQFSGQPSSVLEVVTSKGITAGVTSTFSNSWI